MSSKSHQTVMISYRSDDVAFVEELVAYCKSRDVYPWLDRDGIPPGSPWRDVLLEKLRTCDACIVVLSPRYLASEHCRMEAFVARSFGRKIVPIMQVDCLNLLRDHEETKGLENIFMMRMCKLDAFGLLITRNEAFARTVDGALGIGRLPASAKPIYISYASPDAEFATNLSIALEHEEIPTWVATRDIAVGENWRDAQARAMMRAGAHLVILDENIVGREILRTEVLLAEARGIPAFTVLPERLQDRPEEKGRLLDNLTNSDLTYRRLAATQFFPSNDGVRKLAKALSPTLRLHCEL